jgi:hypothetical protein
MVETSLVSREGERELGQIVDMDLRLFSLQVSFCS